MDDRGRKEERVEADDTKGGNLLNIEKKSSVSAMIVLLPAER